ncbi:MAG: hypothetical protein H7067_11615 [Burkholderiales bacterium]|nr:hypothetical protein [Opitutaceae bacterium]
MNYAKILLGIALAGIVSGQAAVNYVGVTSGTDFTTVIDLSSDPSGTYGGSYDSATRTWTWSAADTFVLQEIITIANGTLVIEAGSVVRGQPRADGATYNSGSLLIARSAKLIADGTAADPIIFTTASTTGATTGGRASGASPAFWDANPKTAPQPAATAGVWGGVLLLGYAPTNVDRFTSTTSVNIYGERTADYNASHVLQAYTMDDSSGIEGVPNGTAAVSGGHDRFGGSQATHNSGILRYASIRHGGANLGPNNEINGLTLGGVGSGTTVEFIEIWGNTDDGIEIFGGTVNLNNVAVFYAQDDGIDLDVGYTGTIQFALVVAGSLSDKLGEWDGSYQGEPITFTGDVSATTGAVSASLLPVASYTIANATFIGNPNVQDTITTSSGRHSLHIRDQSAARLVNSIVVNPNLNAIEVDTRGTEDEHDTTRRLQQGVAYFRGVTCYDATATDYTAFNASATVTTAVTTAAAWVNDGSNDTMVEAALERAANLNYFNQNPGFAKVPVSVNANQATRLASQDGALGSGLALNPVPNSSGTADAGSFDVVLDDTIAGYNDSLQFASYRGAFDPTLSLDLWTTGWTAASTADVIVAKGDGSL